MEELDKVSKLESICTSLTSSKLSNSQIVDCLELLMKLLTKFFFNFPNFYIFLELFISLINNPAEAKFRTIKKSNQTLKNKLFISPIIETILQNLEFSLIDDSYVYLNELPFDLINSLPVIRNSIDEIRDQSLPLEERVKKNELRVKPLKNNY